MNIVILLKVYRIVFAQKFPTSSGLGKIVTTNIISPDELPDQEYP